MTTRVYLFFKPVFLKKTWYAGVFSIIDSYSTRKTYPNHLPYVMKHEKCLKILQVLLHTSTKKLQVKAIFEEDWITILTTNVFFKVVIKNYRTNISM